MTAVPRIRPAHATHWRVRPAKAPFHVGQWVAINPAGHPIHFPDLPSAHTYATKAVRRTRTLIAAAEVVNQALNHQGANDGQVRV